MGNSDLIIDSFAGGGGASLGIAWAMGGRGPDIAINHDAEALAMHEANHPSTLHVREDVWRTDLRRLTKGRNVELLWASPDCKHFSRAKGGKPVEKSIRSLAWIVCKWADQVRPRMIALENVREFADWGPLVPRWVCKCGWKGTEGQAVLARTRRRCPSCDSLRLRVTDELVPCPKRKGLTFRRFVGRLKNLGYSVEWRNLDAADYGAPTHRRRLFLVARCDGQPIEWPEPTHGKGRRPYRTAAECIDWSIPCPSIFERKRPLAEKTMRRIALGIKRYVLDASEPFIVQLAHGEGKAGRWGSGSNSVNDPLGTVHSGGNNHAVVSPVLSKFHGAKSAGDSRCKQLHLPFNTLDTQPRFALLAPIVAQTSHTGTTGRGNYAWSPEEPVRTLSQSNEFALIAPTLVTVGHGERAGQEARALDPQKPIGTTTSKGHHALVAAYLAKHFGGMVGVEADTPLPTTTERGTQNQLVAANLIHMNHGDKQWSSVDDPMRTLTSGKHAALVYSFLTRFFGSSVGQELEYPAPTGTGMNKTGIVTVTIAGETYVIVDIGMRMLSPRELARAQGFPDTYILTGTKTSQVARIGNSVCPQVAAAIVKANCLEAAGVSA